MASSPSSGSRGIQPADVAAGSEKDAHEVSIALNSVPIPDSFKCPLTLEVMHDSVATVDGHVYEKKMIQQWFQRGNMVSPKTRCQLPSLALTAEVSFGRAIEEYLRVRPGLVRSELDNRSLQQIARMLELELTQKQNQVSRVESGEANPCALLTAIRKDEISLCYRLLSYANFRDVNCKDCHFRSSQGFMWRCTSSLPAIDLESRNTNHD